MKTLLISILSIVIVGCGQQSGSNDRNDNVKATFDNDNVKEMVRHMEEFHKECNGESEIFRASGERTAISMWESKYPENDIQQAIKILKPTLFTDSEIDAMKHGNLIPKGNRVIQ
jgi:hypothetical protein